MLQAESVQEYSKADALAIDALFKRLAARGRAIRMQKQALKLDQAEKPMISKASSSDQDGPDCDPLPLIGSKEAGARPAEGG